MNYHKLLSRQIPRYLPACANDKLAIKKFLKVISESYETLERDKELAERAFTLSEQEYVEINDQLKAEAEVKKLSIAKLKEAVGTITGHYLENDNQVLYNLLSNAIKFTEKGFVNCPPLQSLDQYYGNRFLKRKYNGERKRNRGRAKIRKIYYPYFKA